MARTKATKGTKGTKATKSPKTNISVKVACEGDKCEIKSAVVETPKAPRKTPASRSARKATTPKAKKASSPVKVADKTKFTTNMNVKNPKTGEMEKKSVTVLNPKPVYMVRTVKITAKNPTGVTYSYGLTGTVKVGGVEKNIFRIVKEATANAYGTPKEHKPSQKSLEAKEKKLAKKAEIAAALAEGKTPKGLAGKLAKCKADLAKAKAGAKSTKAKKATGTASKKRKSPVKVKKTEELVEEGVEEGEEEELEYEEESGDDVYEISEIDE